MNESTCRRCQRAITTDPALASDMFEGMHWLCFHLEFEHTGDPDVPCGDPTCYRTPQIRESLVPASATDLADEAERATSLLQGKTGLQCWRPSSKQVGLRFSDGTSLFVDQQPNGLELSIT